MKLSEDIKHGLACTSVDKEGSVIGKTACLVAHPGRMALFPLVRWFHARYHGKYKFARTLFAIDLVLVGILIGLAITALVIFITKPGDIGEKIRFEAIVAPREVVSGAASTLVIRFTNESKETLNGAKLHLSYPAHFERQEVSYADNVIEGDTVSLETIDPGEAGSVRVRGVMFGDVGGEQVFRSNLSFTYGEQHLAGQKTAVHRFSPSRSTLTLALTLPDRVIAGNPFDGTVAYTNTGDVDFPEIGIEPVWPEGFRLVSTEAPLRAGAYHLPAVKAGTSGTWTFRGVMADGGTHPFTLKPSFVFGDDRYTQQSLTQDVVILPSPLVLTHTLDGASVRAGAKATAKVTYRNAGDTVLHGVTLNLESTSAFARPGTPVVIGTVEPGVEGEVDLSLPLRSTVSASEWPEGTRAIISVRPVASFRLGDEQTAFESRGTATDSPLTTPVILGSIGRYTGPGGDQLGRGPLPPLVGEETKYWVFWNVGGTISDLERVRIEGDLGPNVRFTGRQSVSIATPVTYDGAEGSISWETDKITSTLSAGSRVVGVGFELGIIPSPEMVGTIPVLMRNVRLTAVDAATGVPVSVSGANVTTNLPGDELAGGLAKVEN